MGGRAASLARPSEHASEPATGRLEQLLAEASWLEGLARVLVRDQGEAHDLVQDVWVAAAERAPDRIERPRAWLAQVLRNALRSRRRAQAPREVRERARARGASVSATGEVVARAEAQRALVEHVLALDEPWRSTVLLRFFDDLSSEAIARRTGVPPSTVRNRLAHALVLLRERLERSRGTDWMAGIAPLAAGAWRAGTAIGWTGGGVLVGGMLKVGGGLAAAVLAAWWWVGPRATEPVGPRRVEPGTRAPVPALAPADGVDLVAAREPLANDPEPLAQPVAPPAAAAPAPAPDLSSGVLEIVVLDSGNRCPHPGRVVLAAEWRPWMGSAEEEPPEEAVERVLVNGGARFEGLAPGSYGVRASPADHVELYAHVVVPEASGVLVTLRSASSSVEGTAWDEEGRPMRDAKVVLSHEESHTKSFTSTLDDGSYALTRLEAGPHFVSLNGGEVIRSSTTLSPGRNRLDFGSPVPRPHWRGRLRTRSGAEHRGRVVLWLRPSEGLTTRTIDDGRFDLRLLPGTYRISAKPDAYSSYEVELGEIVIPLEDIERDLVLPGARVSGIVRKVDDSSIGLSMSVGLRHPGDGSGSRSVPVGEDGRFTIDALEPGIYLLNTHPLVVDGGVDSLRFELYPGQDELVLEVGVRAP